MSNYIMGAGPYVVIGLVIYLIFRALIWLLYYKGEMRVPVWHEAGFALLTILFFLLFTSSVTPVLGFSLKPDLKGIAFIPVKGSIDLIKDQGFGALLGAVLKFVPLGFLIPFLFRRFQSFFKVFFLCGGNFSFYRASADFPYRRNGQLGRVSVKPCGNLLGLFPFWGDTALFSGD